jgi:hypothetical protein
MDVATAYGCLRENLDIDVGSFYSPGQELSLGAGKMYRGVRVPIFNEETFVFQTALSPVYVLTHECDVDQGNDREFNDYVLVCPLIPFERFVQEYCAVWDDEQFRGFLSSLARRRVSRVLYIPPVQELSFGALMYLNQITSTHVAALSHEHASPIGAVTTRCLRVIDHFLENHLLRPKAEALGLSF